MSTIQTHKHLTTITRDPNTGFPHHRALPSPHAGSVAFVKDCGSVGAVCIWALLQMENQHI